MFGDPIFAATFSRGHMAKSGWSGGLKTFNARPLPMSKISASPPLFTNFIAPTLLPFRYISIFITSSHPQKFCTQKDFFLLMTTKVVSSGKSPSSFYFAFFPVDFTDSRFTIASRRLTASGFLKYRSFSQNWLSDPTSSSLPRNFFFLRLDQINHPVSAD